MIRAGDVDLDATDRRLIELLCDRADLGPRALAKQLEIGERAVIGRLRRLSERGWMRIHAVADLPSFGYVFQAILRISVEPGKAARAGRELAAIEEIVGLTGVLGDCDFAGVLVARTQDQLNDCIEKRIAQIAGVVSIQLDLLLDFASYETNVAMLEPSPSSTARLPLRAEHTKGRFDETDVAIVEALREDASRSNREIARRLDSSEPTIRRRLDRMKTARAFDVCALVDPRVLGLGYTGWAWIEADYGKQRAIAGRLARIDGLDAVALVASGRSNLFTVITHGDAVSCAEMIRREVLTTPGVHRVHVMQATDLLKQDFFWRRLL